MSETISRTKINKSIERRILIGMIVSSQFLKEVRELYRHDFFKNKHAGIIVKWCFDYYNQYEKAPMQHIQDIYDTEEVRLDEDASKYVENLLSSLSDDYAESENFNVGYLLDEATKHFKTRSLELLGTGILEYTRNGDTEGAEELYSTYKKVERIGTVGVDPFSDDDKIRRAFESGADPLFRMPGAFGNMINHQLIRTGFVAFMGPEKRGKSFWGDEFALRALRGRCNVALFDMGDMDEDERRCRLFASYAGRPVQKYTNTNIYRVPVVDCVHNQNDTCDKEERKCFVGLYDNGKRLAPEEAKALGYIPCSSCIGIKGVPFYENQEKELLSWQEAIEIGKQVLSRYKGKRMKLSCHENSSVSAKGINSILETWKYFEDFVPDVIVVDYADIMAPEDSKQMKRDQENDRWKALRGLAQRWKSLVITFTQSDANSYDKENIGLGNFSEDKRKYGHVTAMYSLNQTDDERENGIMRIGEMVVRKGPTNRKKKTHILECRSIGKIYTGSYF